MRLVITLLILGLGWTARANWPLPTNEGTTWRYRLTAEPENTTAVLTREISPAELPKLGQTMRLETKIGGRSRATAFLKNIGNAIFAVGRRRSDGSIVGFEPPVTVLPAGDEANETWNFTGDVAGLECELDFHILGEEEITVPAGKFRATHLHGEQSGSYKTTAERWFVRDLGWAKEIVTQRAPSGELLLRNTIELLDRPAAPLRTSPTAVKKPLEVSVSTSSDGDPLSTISADALQIVARWHGHGLGRGTKLRAVWIAENTGDTAPTDYVVDEATAIVTSPEAYGRFTLARPADGWAMGRYRVEFYLGPTLMETAHLIIGRASPRMEPTPNFLNPSLP